MRGGMALVFVLALLGVLGAGCAGGDEVAPLPETVITNGEETPPAPTDEEPGDEEPGDEEPPPEDPQVNGDPEAGSEVFNDAGCGGCHALADAQSTASIGINLDERQPTAEEVATAVRTGPGAMPAFEGQLDDEQIANVSAYVAQAAGGGGE